MVKRIVSEAETSLLQHLILVVAVSAELILAGAVKTLMDLELVALLGSWMAVDSDLMATVDSDQIILMTMVPVSSCGGAAVELNLQVGGSSGLRSYG